MLQPVNQFVGYVHAERRADGFLVIQRLTDFGNPACHHRASDVQTRLPYTLRAVQGFIVTDAEAAALHGGV